MSDVCLTFLFFHFALQFLLFSVLENTHIFLLHLALFTLFCCFFYWSFVCVFSYHLLCIYIDYEHFYFFLSGFICRYTIFGNRAEDQKPKKKLYQQEATASFSNWKFFSYTYRYASHVLKSLIFQ